MLKKQNLVGQWVGYSQYEGGSQAFTVVNIEARSPEIAQLVSVSRTQSLTIRTSSIGRLSVTGDTVTGTSDRYEVFDFENDQFIPLPIFYERAGNKEKPPTSATYSGKFKETVLSGDFVNDLGQKGKFEFWPSFGDFTRETLKSKLPPPSASIPLTWSEFKNEITRFRGQTRIYFRGQRSNEYPLRTLFHRTGRNNLVRFVNEDIPKLRHKINATSQHYYQPLGEDFLGLLSLAQHHGFPTPLLDWSLSPYVAAFFAFDCQNHEASHLKNGSSSAVRIFAFDENAWDKSSREKATSLKDPWPDLQFVHPPAHNNPRYYPQQSIAAFSNVYDIEGFIAGLEIKFDVKCLYRFDIRADQRKEVVEDLRFMGITAATLFPGLEGICRDLRSELF